MRGRRLISIAALAAGAWLGMTSGFAGGSPAIPTAAAQGTLTPLAGQPSATAPGGLRGRGLRRYSRVRPRRFRRR